MQATCALCLNDRELQKSHYMPSGSYRAVCVSHNPNDNAPVYIDLEQGTAFKSNKQAKKHLLCSECEGRFSELGESKVLRQIDRGENSFKLLDELTNGTPSDITNGKKIYGGPHFPPNVDGEAYLYFASSIFWRGSITRWPRPLNSFYGALGKTYEEAVRRYLLGEDEFPKEARVSVFVDAQRKTRGLSYFPTTSRGDWLGRPVHKHSFLLSGVHFFMTVGGALRSFPDVGTSSAHRISFFEWRPEGTDFHQSMLQNVKGAEPKGSMTKK